MKEFIKYMQKNGKIFLAHRLEDIIKMSVLLKAVCRFSAILIKLSMAFFTDLEEKNPKLHVKLTTKHPELPSNPKREKN